MTNKINGIDVSECEYLNKVVNEEPYCNIDQEHLYTCSSDENCYFKQEIRKKLKKYDANISDTIIANPIQDCYDTYKLIDEALK